MATEWHQILVRLTPNTYAKLRRASEHVAIPPAVLARSILTQQLDKLVDPSDSTWYGDRPMPEKMSRAERRRLERERKKGGG